MNDQQLGKRSVETEDRMHETRSADVDHPVTWCGIGDERGSPLAGPELAGVDEPHLLEEFERTLLHSLQVGEQGVPRGVPEIRQHLLAGGIGETLPGAVDRADNSQPRLAREGQAGVRRLDLGQEGSGSQDSQHGRRNDDPKRRLHGTPACICWRQAFEETDVPADFERAGRPGPSGPSWEFSACVRLLGGMDAGGVVTPSVARRKPLMNNRRELLLSASHRAHCGHAAAMPSTGLSQRLRLVTTRDSSPNAAPAGTAESSAYEAEFLKHLSLVDGIAGFVCQRHKLTGSEADDFRSEVRLRLMDRDYEVFRRFQQRSSLRTYLTIVIQRIYLDYRNRLWGKWRPSAEARRLGPLAIRLETLVSRDGLSFDQACEILRTNEGVMATESDLAEMAIRLPLRQRRTIVGEEALEGVPSARAFDDRVLSKERQDAARRVTSALAGAVTSLGDQDRLILRLKFQEGLGVADISRALHLEQKPLYRRFDLLMQTLREALEAAGISRLEAIEIVNRQDVDISLALVGGTLGSRRPTVVKGSSRG